MTNGKARNNGGAIYATGTGAATLTFASCGATISYFESKLNGGFLYVNNPSLSISTSGCDWNHLYSTNSGGFIYGASLKSFSLTGCNMLNITSKVSGSFFVTTATGYDFAISTCIFKCLSTYD